MNVAFLGLGGNIGDRMNTLRRTREALNAECGTLIKASSIYETAAWGSDSENKYLNQVIQLKTSLTTDELLRKILSVEMNLGRVRTNQQNSDRTSDIDILFFNSEIIHSNQLHIPHPRLHLRKFVLIPLCEIAPLFEHPVLQKTMTELLKSCEDKLEVKVVSAS